MICPLNAGDTKTRQCVGERCAWLVTLKRYFDDDVRACAMSWIAFKQLKESVGEGFEVYPQIYDYGGDSYYD